MPHHTHSQSKMEGACGKILDTEAPNVVIKKIHRRRRAQQRTNSLSAEEQAAMQTWAASVCRTAGFSRLFVPKAWGAEKNLYKMERIQTDTPLELAKVVDHPVRTELQQFYSFARKASIFPADYELYIQPDGRVAMIDFDKFASWQEDGSVRFPWGLELSRDQIQQSVPFSL